MKKNTNCQRCIFSSPVGSETCCEFDLPNLLKDKKEILIDNGYYYIKNYACKYAFSKTTDSQQQTKASIIEYIQNKNLSIDYYLVLYCKDECITQEHLNILNNIKIRPKIVSFIFDFPQLGLNAIDLLNRSNNTFKYKVHNLLQNNLPFSTIISNVIETNLTSCDQDYVFFKNIKDIELLESDIISIQEIINIYQPICDIITSTRYNISELFDLFLPTQYYLYIKDFFKKNFKESLLSIPDPQIAYYA